MYNERKEKRRVNILVSSGVLAGSLGDQRRSSISNLLETGLSTSLISVLSTSILLVSGDSMCCGEKGEERERIGLEGDLPP